LALALLRWQGVRLFRLPWLLRFVLRLAALLLTLLALLWATLVTNPSAQRLKLQ
jgi:hypothetical protein